MNINMAIFTIVVENSNKIVLINMQKFINYACVDSKKTNIIFVLIFT